ncbi:MAG: glutathione-regulated potassium-efflux system ancillary protein KefC [Oceanicoccus sp.]|jgi:glutathione-regulated potassium-efflux system ancillary protein KefC
MLVSALIYLFAAVLSVPIAKRLGLGSVLGYLIAGVLIGPFVFHLVGDQTEVMHFAEFGVVMMLFLVGLELRPSRLWEMRRPILGLGGLQVILTAAIICALVMLISDFVWQVSLAIGLTLALSSTAIVLQSLTERGLLKTPAGANSFSVLLFQDIAVIPILALLPLLAVGEVINNADVHDSLISHLPVWVQVVITSATILAIVLGGKYLAAPFFRFIAETRLREVFTAFALLIVVAITVLMQAIGLSPALGSFLAGVVLADNEFRHELEVDIEPFKGLLLGLFFITVGASIDFQLLINEPLFIGLSVFALIAVKIVVLAGIAAVSNMTRSQGMLFTLALAQGGEFAFVLASSARQFSVFDDALVNMITVVVALSMLISPLLLVAYEVYFSRKSQQAQPEHDTDIDSTEEVILAGYGRFGQIIGRLLTAQGYNLTILDHSPGQVELVRRFGNKVYYGDAARRDLLEAAGANEAKLLVIAVDEPDKTLDIIHTAQTHFPHLKILARAIDRSHAYAILHTKIDGLRRETFDSALHLGVDALQILGLSQEDAQHAGTLFEEHDEENLCKLAEVWGNDKQYGIAVQKGLLELKQVLKEDAKDRKKKTIHGH